MRKWIVYGSVCLCILAFLFHTSFAQAKKMSQEECFDQFNDKVMQDVISSFSELRVLSHPTPNEYAAEYTHEDLDKAIAATGGVTASYLEPVNQLYEGAFRGEPRFFVATPEGEVGTDKYESAYVGYFLYKTSEGTNVMVKLRSGKTSWDVVDKKEAKGKNIAYKCGK